MDKLEFYCRLALEQRLSIETTAKLAGVTKEELESYYTNDLYHYQYKFLFNLEMFGVDDSKKYLKLRTMLSKLSQPNRSEEEIKKDMDYLLYKTDREFEELMENPTEPKKDFYIKVSRYRLKYAMAGTEICDKIGIDRRVLSSYECSYDDLELKNKLKKLEEFIRYTKIKREWKKDNGRSRA